MSPSERHALLALAGRLDTYADREDDVAAVLEREPRANSERRREMASDLRLAAMQLRGLAKMEVGRKR